MLQTRRLSKLIRDLEAPDPSKRRAAAESLANGDERAIYPLIKALGDENPGVQDAAMRSLITIGGEVTAYMVIPLLRNEPFLRNTAMIILKEIGAPVIPLLYPLLRDKDDDVRKFAIDLISEIRECDYPWALSQILEKDPNPNVRASAAKAIGVIGYRDGLPQLITALRDDEWVSFSALESLALIGDESSVEPIISLLDSPSDTLRYASIEALGRIGSTRGINALMSHLPKTDGLERTAIIKGLVQIGITPDLSEVSDTLMDMFEHGDWEERLIALKGLVALKDERAIYPAIDLAGSLDPSEPDNEERLSAIKEALLSLGCADALIDIVSNPSVRYRGKVIAIEVVGDLRCKKAVPYLVRLLEGNLRDVRRASIKALGEMDDEDARQALMGAVNDGDGHIRKMAAAALGRMGERRAVDPLLRLLEVERYRDVMEEAVRALLMIDPAALYNRLDGLNSQVREAIGKYSGEVDILIALSMDGDLDVKVSAISGLGRVQDERSYKRLAEAMYETEPEVRRASVMAMGELNCCYDALISALNDSDMWVRLYAVRALGRSSRQDMIRPLMPMLDDREVPVVLSAVDAIGMLADMDAPRILSPLLNHRDVTVRERVARVMECVC